MNNKLYIVIPCYNEEEVIEDSAKKILDKLKKLISKKMISNDSRILFVNDGSKDNTWKLIENLIDKNEHFMGIKLSTNKGHQNALLSGLMYSIDKCDMTISMDADLQDDIDTVDEFIKKYNEGCDIVYGVRSSRKKDSFFKRNTAILFYKLMKFLGVKTIYNHADYRLMSNRAVIALSEYKEVNLFLRGIVPLIGYKTDCVYYERKERLAGETKYPLKKMINLAMNGITSFSIQPIKYVFFIGILIFILSIIYGIYVIIGYFNGNSVSGWTSLILSLWLLGGFQIISIGIIGEYIGKMYLETKHRPRYIIEEVRKNETKTKTN